MRYFFILIISFVTFSVHAQSFYDSIWESSEVFVYDENGNLSQKIVYTYNSDGDIESSTFYAYYSFDVDGKMTYNEPGVLSPVYRNKYVYEILEKERIVSIYQSDYKGGEWGTERLSQKSVYKNTSTSFTKASVCRSIVNDEIYDLNGRVVKDANGLILTDGQKKLQK